MDGQVTKAVEYVEYWATISLNTGFLHLLFSKEQIHSRSKKVS